MGYAELINQRLQTLPQAKQAEVYDFVEFIATRPGATEILDEEQRQQQVLATLVTARDAWPKLSAKEMSEVATSMRAEWDGRGWESRR